MHTPHGLDRTREIKPHLHFYARVDPVTAKTVNWRLEYKVYQHGWVVPTDWTTVNIVQTLTSADYNESSVVAFGPLNTTSRTEFEPMSMTACRPESVISFCRSAISALLLPCREPPPALKATGSS